MPEVEVRILSWVRAMAAEIRTGLMGYIVVEYGNLVLDGITLRRTAEGRFVLSFPSRTDRAGRRHPYIRPIDEEARRQIEAKILGELGQWGEAS